MKSTNKMNMSQSRRKAATISLVISLILFTVKSYAYLITGSQAIFSDALETVVNVAAAIVTLVVVIVAAKPADEDHPYGHGKFELLASGFEGGTILVAGLFIAFEAISALFHGVELQKLNMGLGLVALAGAINGILGLYLIRAGKKYHSKSLEASGLHVLSDFWTSLGVLLGLAIVLLSGIYWLDPVIAIIVAVQLSVTGFGIVKRTGAELLDAEDRGLIEELAGLFRKYKFPGIIRIHHTRVMRSGSFHHVDCHVVVPSHWTIEEGHDNTDRFENLVLKEYAHEGEFHFHIDPCQRRYCAVCDLEPCKIREKPYSHNVPFSLEELLSPEEKPLKKIILQQEKT
ncbi:MAG: cation transporter [Oligoflexales bacterium]|nr:cation transporter [Oligoflexales bacterium]